MKIEFITRTEEEIRSCNYRDAVRIKIDGETVFSVSDGEPEDSTLSRNFNDVYQISDLLKKAHDAGINGDKFEITYIETKEI